VKFPRDVFLRPEPRLRPDGQIHDLHTNDNFVILRFKGQVYEVIVSEAGTETHEPGDLTFLGLSEQDFDALWDQFERWPR